MSGTPSTPESYAVYENGTWRNKVRQPDGTYRIEDFPPETELQRRFKAEMEAARAFLDRLPENELRALAQPVHSGGGLSLEQIDEALSRPVDNDITSDPEWEPPTAHPKWQEFLAWSKGLNPNYSPSRADMMLLACLEERKRKGIDDRRTEAATPESQQNGEQKPTKMSLQEAESRARRTFRELREHDNKTLWAKRIGCNRKLVRKLPTWARGQKWRAGREQVKRQLGCGTVSGQFLDALAEGTDLLDELITQEERDAWEGQSPSQRDELLALVQEQEIDDQW